MPCRTTARRAGHSSLRSRNATNDGSSVRTISDPHPGTSRAQFLAIVGDHVRQSVITFATVPRSVPVVAAGVDPNRSSPICRCPLVRLEGGLILSRSNARCFEGSEVRGSHEEVPAVRHVSDGLASSFTQRVLAFVHSQAFAGQSGERIAWST